MRRINIFASILFLLIVAGCSGNGSDTVIEESGTIEFENVVVSAKVGGQVIQILKDEGSDVTEGDTILVIDHENLDLQLKQSMAAKNAVQAQLDLLRSGARIEDISQAKEIVSQAETNLNLVSTDRSRFEKLLNERAITRKQFDDVDARYKVALSQYNSAKANLKKVKNMARKEEITALAAKVNQAEAAADLIKKGIRDSYITSPINGQIVKSFIETGETAAPMSSLVKINNLSNAEMIIYVSETDLGRVKLGQRVEISTDTFKDKAYEGRVTFISPEAEFTPKNIQTKDERTKLVFAVKIKASNPDRELKAGMPADAKIFISE